MAGRDKYRARRRGKICSSPRSMGLASSQRNQTAECGVCILTTNQSRRCGIQPTTAMYPPQPTKPITAVLSFKHCFKKLTSESLSRPPLVSSLQIPRDDDAAPSRLAPAAVSAQPSNSSCRTSSSSDYTARTSPMKIHPINQGLHKPRHRLSSLCNQCVYLIDRLQQHLPPASAATIHERPHCSSKLQHFEATSTHTQLTKDCINRDIDHPASATNASTSSTISSNIYNLTIQLHLQSAPNTKTILTF